MEFGCYRSAWSSGYSGVEVLEGLRVVQVVEIVCQLLSSLEATWTQLCAYRGTRSSGENRNTLMQSHPESRIPRHTLCHHG